MATDVVVSSELRSLQDELEAARRERSAAVATPRPADPADAVLPVRDASDERELHDLLGQLVDEAGSFIDDAERTVAAHPARSVLGALVVGILIGRLLGRR